ncbi:PP2C family protein-serine/threonine phosphatase [Actinokineospora fastidiosa]|nr:protein phosphatase 2C domain-containing protein [Actinokineospora fastidiosa]
MRAGVATDIGAVRGTNQDSHLVQGRVFAVADGMGGHSAGEVASGIAVTALAGLAELESVGVDEVKQHVAKANADILATASREPDKAGMGTTLTGLCLIEVGGTPHWAVFNLGDSRVYRFHDGAVEQLTADHSEVADLVRAGRITEPQARAHPARMVLTKALGTADAEPEIRVLPVVAGERFLLCSDGLTGELSDAEIAERLGAEDDPQTLADALVGAAVAAGGRDNVTVVVVDNAVSMAGPAARTAPRKEPGT